MHVNWRRNFRRPGGPMARRGKGRGKSFAWKKKESWRKRRERERQALIHGEEMPRWRKTIRYEWS